MLVKLQGEFANLIFTPINTFFFMPGSNSSLDDHQLLQDNIKMVERLTIVDENPDFTSDVGGSDRKNLIFDELQFEDDEEEEEDGMSTTGGQVKGNFFELISYEYLQQLNTYILLCVDQHSLLVI